MLVERRQHNEVKKKQAECMQGAERKHVGGKEAAWNVSPGFPPTRQGGKSEEMVQLPCDIIKLKRENKNKRSNQATVHQT